MILTVTDWLKLVMWRSNVKVIHYKSSACIYIYMWVLIDHTNSKRWQTVQWVLIKTIRWLTMKWVLMKTIRWLTMKWVLMKTIRWLTVQWVLIKTIRWLTMKWVLMKTIYKVIDFVVSVGEDEHIIQYGSHLFLWYSGMQHTCFFSALWFSTPVYLALRCNTPVSLVLWAATHLFLWYSVMQHTCFFGTKGCSIPVSLVVCDAAHLFLWY